jgi:peptidyl-prolyl cis-trans isomerase B (cyclophilin B)
MNRYLFILLCTLIVSVVSCGSGENKSDDALVSIKTEYGEIKVKLYTDTPEHKKNFLKLVNEGFYNDLLFHRVINNFMIQGGDPESKNAAPGIRLGGGSPGYTIPAEIIPTYFHKKGALAAARKGGPSNPEKRSSGSQFYIIHGETFSAGKLDTLEMMKNNRTKNELMKEKFSAASTELNEFQKNQDKEGFNVRVTEIREEVDSIFNAGPQFKFSDAQKKAYTTIGGYPSLDGDYTVFGEVVEGLNVLDKIAALETDKYDRPLGDVKMKVEIAK